MTAKFISSIIILLLRLDWVVTSEVCKTENEAPVAPLPPKVIRRVPSTPLSTIDYLLKNLEPFKSSAFSSVMEGRERIKKHVRNSDDVVVLPAEIQDLEEECSKWADEGDCNIRPEFMLKRCTKSCLKDINDKDFDLLAWGVIEHYNEADEDCVDWHMVDIIEGNIEPTEEACEDWAEQGLCKSADDKHFMLTRCSRACMVCIPPDEEEFDIGVPQALSNATLWKESLDVMIRTSEYMSKVVMDTRNEKYESVRRDCYNTDPYCSEYAASGHCEKEHEFYVWMIQNCAPACQTCELVDFSIRCPIPEGSVDALISNDDELGLNNMFERMVDGIDDLNYTTTIYSRPMREDEDEIIGDFVDGPWVVRLDNLLTDEECNRLIEIGQKQGYEVSTETSTNRDGSESEKKVSKRRTSTGTFCETCYEDPLAKRVIEKIGLITGFPIDYSEDLQLLQYKPGQYYKRHHDYISSHTHGPSGPRVLTVLLYLNDVEEGGGTRFNELAEGVEPVDVQPKKGSALVWPSVLHEDILSPDFRTEHEALPVVKGFKYAANAWLHLRDEQNVDELCK
jgi:prolyl 4-hydroxylase